LSASDPWPLALRLLARQGRSVAELERKLGERGYSAAQIAPVLERCRELGYLDDARFARERAGALLRSGRAVGRRLLLDLQRRGIDNETARAALTEVGAACDPAQVLRTLLERRYPGFDFAAASPAEKRRITDFFLRRGFPLPLVLSILSKREVEDPP
jgi:regulatory protein